MPNEYPPNPTASQVYLAADILASLHGDPGTETIPHLRRMAAGLLSNALTRDGWHGKVDGQCSEYGKPPTMADPEAQDAVRKLHALQVALAEYYHAQLGDEAQSVLKHFEKVLA